MQIDEIEAFFRDYHELEGTTFEPIGRVTATQAMRLLERGTSHQG